MTTVSEPALLGLDWGTSSLRAFLLSADGAVLETRHADAGLQRIGTAGAAGFAQALAQIAGDWLQRWPALPLIACGMVGSAQGWREAPYVACPADAQALAQHGVRVDIGDGRVLRITPGVCRDADGPLPDVMRGEETQVVGALCHAPAWTAAARFVLPGTHSKWVRVADGRIVGLDTYLTGEMFAVLRGHSILGRLMQGDAADPAAFVRGLDTARRAPGDLLHHVFSARTLGLTGQLPGEALAEYLSGLLIGHELVAGLAQATDAPLVLVGEPALCRRYAEALRHLGHPAQAVLGNTAPQGLWSLACAAGLL